MRKKPDINASASPVMQPALSVAFTPLALRADEAARYIGATTFFIEEIMRAGGLPFVTVGKRRVIYLDDLKAWFEKERTKQRQRFVAA